MPPASQSFYWFDLETSGLNSRWDRPIQFAGQRTDRNLNPIGEPLVRYIALPPQVLPSPSAALITGISPYQLQSDGVSEWEAINEIHQELSQPGTCGIGYNNIAFDDEFIRFALFRNLLPPYAREFQHGNSRADLYTIVRAAAAMRPEYIKWPRDEEGVLKPSLAALAEANGIDSEGAHDALTDVHMSIELARVLRIAQPKLWSYLMTNCTRQQIEQTLQDGSRMYLNVSSSYGAKRAFAAPVRVIGQDPEIKTRVYVVDLASDLSILETASPAELNEARFLTKEEAEKTGRTRLGIYQVAINRYAVVVGIDRLTDALAERLCIDVELVDRNIEMLDRLKGSDFDNRIAEMLRLASEWEQDEVETDFTERLYDSFISDSDARACEEIHAAIANKQPWPDTAIADRRVQVLATRLRYELRPHEVPQLETKHFYYVQKMLRREDVGVAAKRKEIKELREGELTPENAAILDDVEAYVRELASSYEV